MNWWQAVLTIFLGNCIVLVPMVLNAHAGTAYGIPFPVYCRAAFGIRGANVPALLRALVACGWFGIQTWIGGMGHLQRSSSVYVPDLDEACPRIPGLGINLPQARLLPRLLGAQRPGRLARHRHHSRAAQHQGAAADRPGPGAAGLGVSSRRAASGRCCRSPRSSRPGGPKAGRVLGFFFPALTANVGFWATLSLNIPDFSRYARSQRDQVVGQALGLADDDGACTRSSAWR